MMRHNSIRRETLVLNDANQNLIYRALRKIKQVVKNVTKGCIAGHLSPLSILKLRIGPDALRTSLTAPCCGVVCCLCNLMHFDGGNNPRIAPYPGNTRFLGPTRVHNLNSTSICSSVFVGLTVVTNRHTDRLAHATSLHSIRAMQPNNLFLNSTAAAIIESAAV